MPTLLSTGGPSRAKSRRSSSSEEIADQLDRGARILFHDPVARIGNDALRHVVATRAHDSRHHRTERALDLVKGHEVMQPRLRRVK